MDVASVFDEQDLCLSCGQEAGLVDGHPLGRPERLVVHMGVVAEPLAAAANFACRQGVVSSRAVEDLLEVVVVEVPGSVEVPIDQDLVDLPIVLVVHLALLQLPCSDEVACPEVLEHHFDRLAHHLDHYEVIAIEPLSAHWLGRAARHARKRPAHRSSGCCKTHTA